MPIPVLLVNPNRLHLSVMAASLEANGFDPTLTDDFEDAMARLTAGGFAWLVTSERLGAHDALHLLLRARVSRTMIGSVVTMAKPDQALEDEATLFGARCVVSPWDHPGALLDALVPAESAITT